VLALALAALAAAGARPAAAAPEAAEIRVMSFNIWLGGDVVDFGKVIEAIEGARADIVGLQEAEGNTRRIATALGWPYWSDRLHVVSRLPLIDLPAAKGEYVLVQVRPGAVFALANVHLTSDPYGPYAVRDGKSLRQVLRLERRTRLPEIRATLARVAPLLRRGIPTLMTGDFNSPSHLDWTAAVDAVRPDVRYPVPWPVTEALASEGFQDAYRVTHPDPVAAPGITWTFGYPFPRRAADEVIDRARDE
jgi:endonuclease/exonuclease/phosphatase (EEP) superfamily protein YafD